VPSKRTPLQVRHEAVLKLLARGELDPYEALCLVCWPRKGSRLEDVPLGRQCFSREVRAEIRARHAAGETIPELAVYPLRDCQVVVQRLRRDEAEA
jgi:hypothetical protein